MHVNVCQWKSHAVTFCSEDFLQVSPKNAKYQHVTHFLLDPSCSSSGMTAQPLTGDEVATLTANQQKVIRHAMRFPACQRIAYSTCSILDKENELVVQKALGSQFDRPSGPPPQPHARC